MIAMVLVVMANMIVLMVVIMMLAMLRMHVQLQYVHEFGMHRNIYNGCNDCHTTCAETTEPRDQACCTATISQVHLRNT